MKAYSSDSMQENTEDSIREFILEDHPFVMAQNLITNDNLTIKDYKIMSETEHHFHLAKTIANILSVSGSRKWYCQSVRSAIIL